ncbi:hypothetical protein TYRP_009403 [Tyrophagus putrescentiae]|nr:hypothetical protein TYRP_009403 [Tyrophagus putrescentiae]
MIDFGGNFPREVPSNKEELKLNSNSSTTTTSASATSAHRSLDRVDQLLHRQKDATIVSEPGGDGKERVVAFKFTAQHRVAALDHLAGVH